MIGDLPNAQSLCHVVSMLHTHMHKEPFYFNRLRRIRKKGPNLFLRLQRKKDAQRFFGPAAKTIARTKSGFTLRANSIAVVVAQNGYYDANVAPAQQRNS